jgi:hypothetical protein
VGIEMDSEDILAVGLILIVMIRLLWEMYTVAPGSVVLFISMMGSILAFERWYPEGGLTSITPKQILLTVGSIPIFYFGVIVLQGGDWASVFPVAALWCVMVSIMLGGWDEDRPVGVE